MTNVGMLGLGNMGRPMCRNLVADGEHDVAVWARRNGSADDLVEAGARRAATPRELARHADVVVSMLPDLAQLDELLEGEAGLLAGVADAGSDVVLVVGSTSSPEGVRDLADRLGRVSDGLVHVVDAPVSGGTDGAEAGTLTIMVGGDAADVARVEPVLRSLGAPRLLGPLGSGQVAKACNQLIVASTIVALGEAAVLAERSGIDLGALFDVLGGGYAGGRLLETRRGKFERHDHSVSGPARFMVKDLSFAQAEAVATGTRTVLVDTLLDTFTDLTERGFGDLDITVTQAYVEAGIRDE